MLITRTNVAKAIAHTKDRYLSGPENWDSLPYHAQLSLLAEADRLIAALVYLKDQEGVQDVETSSV